MKNSLLIMSAIYRNGETFLAFVRGVAEYRVDQGESWASRWLTVNLMKSEPLIFLRSAGCFHILYFERETDPSSLLGSQTSL